MIFEFRDLMIFLKGNIIKPYLNSSFFLYLKDKVERNSKWLYLYIFNLILKIPIDLFKCL